MIKRIYRGLDQKYWNYLISPPDGMVSCSFIKGYQIYEQTLMSVFKYLEVTIARRGKQIFRLVNWRDNFGVGLSKEMVSLRSEAGCPRS